MPLPDKVTPPSVKQSPLEIFIDTVCAKAPHATVRARDFYKQFSDWCLSNNYRATSRSALLRDLFCLGIYSEMRGERRALNYSRFLLGIDLAAAKTDALLDDHLDPMAEATINILTDLHTRIHQHTPMQPAALELATNVQQLLTGSMAAHAAVVKSVELDELHGDKAAALDRALVASAASAILALIVLREGTAKTGGIN